MTTAPIGTLYTAPGTPSPDTVHMYLHEAGATDLLTIEKTNINKAVNRSEEFLKLNPMGEVPALALNNGVVITEALVICKYIDALRTNGEGSSLTGETDELRAETDMWSARIESKVMTPLFWAVRCGPLAKFFEDRVPGYIHPEVAEPMAVAANAGFTWLDAQLASDGRSFLCGDRFTIADIRLYVNYKFLTGVHKKLGAVGAEHAVLMEYIARIAAKDSAKFIVPPPRPKKL